MADQKTRAEEFQPAVKFKQKSAGVWRILLLGAILVAGIALAGVYGRPYFGEPLILAVLGAFACIGVFFLFALVLGIISLKSSDNADEFSSNLVDGMDSGVVVSDNDGRVLYANNAYASLIGAASASEIASVEATFSRHAEVADIIYRMSTSAKSGEARVEEFRLASGLLNNAEGPRWFRIRARQMKLDSSQKPMIVWHVSDITKDRMRQESIFQNLQNAVHYLDHAPAGFLASDANGDIVYINATLADWLGIDLVRFESGETKMKDIVVGDGLALLESVKASDGKPGTALIDLDLSRSDGTRLPVLGSLCVATRCLACFI